MWKRLKGFAALAAKKPHSVMPSLSPTKRSHSPPFSTRTTVGSSHCPRGARTWPSRCSPTWIAIGSAVLSAGGLCRHIQKRSHILSLLSGAYIRQHLFDLVENRRIVDRRRHAIRLVIGDRAHRAAQNLARACLR